MKEEQKGFTPRKPWSPCVGEDCTHPSHKCPFCPMFREKGPDIIVITPLNPVVFGHKLVIPREHTEDFTEQPSLTGVVMERAAEEARMTGGQFNLITSKGPDATQTVFHLHVHLVPRIVSDGLKLPWTGQIN